MRNIGLTGALIALAIGATACASQNAAISTSSGEQYASLSPVVSDAPPMTRRTGPVPALADLRSSNPEKLESLLGEPTLRRQDHKSEMWQYASPECVLLIFLYPKGKSVEVTRIEAQPGGISDSALDKCVRAAAARPIPSHS